MAQLPSPRTSALLLGGIGIVAVTFAILAGLPLKESRIVSSPSTGASVRAVVTPAQPGTPASDPEEAATVHPGNYAAIRLAQIKRAPGVWTDAEKWRGEFRQARSTEMQREVLALALQIGAEAFLAVLPQALASEELLTRLEAARSIALLHENRLALGVMIGLSAPGEETRAEVLAVVEQLPTESRPELLRIALASDLPDVRQAAIDLLEQHPTPELFRLLVEGLRTDDPKLRASIGAAMQAIVDQQFLSYEEANRWWTANRDRYDNAMLLAQ